MDPHHTGPLAVCPLVLLDTGEDRNFLSSQLLSSTNSIHTTMMMNDVGDEDPDVSV